MKLRKSLTSLAFAALALSPAVTVAAPEPTKAEKTQPAPNSVPVPANEGPVVEIAFVIDTTGSMGGLIASAKQKIWAIANEFASATPRPRIKIGLVAYRDLKDAYVTQKTPLTPDLDAFYGALQQLGADGGGDTPEAVDAGLAMGIENFGWSKEAKLRFLFLVGDAPPHGQKIAECKRLAMSAQQQGIVLNTILCGNSQTTGKVWQELASAAGGEFLSIDQNATVTRVETPFDKKIAEAQARIENTALFFGSSLEQSQSRGQWASNNDGSLDRETAVARASCLNKTGGYYAQDLLQAVAAGSVDVSKLTKEQLPEELRKLSPEARVAKLAELKAERKAANLALTTLVKSRDGWVTKNVASDSSFDRQLVDCLKDQSKAELSFKK
jgi:Mg-chelatase subunit ChlD